jgi:predicted XRE-type DNA-binding protein
VVVVEDVRSGEDPETLRTRADILEYMRRFNLTQAMLCRPVGVSQSVLSQWMRSRYNGANTTVTDKVRSFLRTYPEGISPDQATMFAQEAATNASGKRGRSQ